MMKVSKPTVMDLRRINRSTVLRRIYLDRSVSRQELSELSGLSSATVTNVVAELLQEGIVIEAGMEASQGGRPRSILTTNPHYGYFIGVEVGDTLTRIELFDLTLHKLGAVAYPAVLSENQPEQVVEYIHQGVKAVLAESGVALEHVLARHLIQPVQLLLPGECTPPLAQVDSQREPRDTRQHLTCVRSNQRVRFG